MKLGRYQNYKGNFYTVLAIALDADTQQKMVVYQAEYDIPTLADEYGINPVFTRAYDSCVAEVEWEGKTVPRFTYVGESKEAA